MGGMMTTQSSSDDMFEEPPFKSAVALDPKMAETVAKVVATFPGSTLILPKNKADEYAVEILTALARLVEVNRGKRVDRNKLWQAMIEVVSDGLMAAERLCEADRRAMGK